MWDQGAGCLRWVDMLNGDILSLNPAGAVDRLHVGGVAAALRPRLRGGLVVAVERGFVLVDANAQVGREHVAFVDPACRMNDGDADRQGRFFCGSMAFNMVEPRGALYRFDPDGTISTVLSGVTISNGIAWSIDGEQMFYVDSVTQRVDLFDYDEASATPTQRRPLIHIASESGMPDGIALDSEGGIWVALWGGGAVHRYRPDGQLDAVIDLPVDLVTACAFGGPDLEELYITTSRLGLAQDVSPSAGALFRLKVGVRGLPCSAFAG
jgi:sugar lactone lactonase YvrE